MIPSISHLLPEFDSRFCLLLTYALVHFVWQGCLLALGFAVLRRALSGASANLRHAAGVTTLVLMAACLPATLAVVDPPADQTIEPAPAVVIESAPAVAIEPAPLPEVAEPAMDVEVAEGIENPHDWSSASISPMGAEASGDLDPSEDTWSTLLRWSRAALASISVYAAGAYVLGLMLMTLRVLVGLRVGNGLRRESIFVTDLALLDLVRAQSARLALRVVPTIAWCRRVSVPLVVGVLRPMILLPFNLAMGMTDEQLEFVVLHELAHIRRYDPIVNLLQRLIEALLFFHPAVWWMSRQVSVEREHACDDAVLRAGCQGPAYAAALLRAAELCLVAPLRFAPATTLAATGDGSTQLRRRILRLFQAEKPAPLRPATPAVAMIVLLCVGGILSLAGWRTAAKAQAADPVAQADEQSDAAEAPPELVPGRVLHFPMDATLGMVSTRAAGNEYLNLENQVWQPIGPARGDVSIPAGCDARLVVTTGAAGDLGGLDGLAPDDLQVLNLCGNRMTSEHLAHVGRLAGLKLLNLSGTELIDGSLVHLKGLEQLVVLYLPPEHGDQKRPRLRAGSIGGLARLPALRKIGLDGREITGELAELVQLEQLEVQSETLSEVAMGHIADMTNLRSLGLHDCLIKTAGMAQLCKLPQLTVLRLEHTSMQVTAIAALADAPALVELEVWLERRSVLRHALVQIAKLKQLRRLSIIGPPTSADLALLAGMTDLESLSIIAPVDNLGAFYLSRLVGLKTLRIEQSRITDSGLNELARLRGLETLTVSGFFTDRGLASLARLAGLKALDAGSPFVTEPAAEALAAGLPGLESINVHNDDPLENRPRPQEEQPAPTAPDSTSAATGRGSPSSRL